jgi:hypothetical protein
MSKMLTPKQLHEVLDVAPMVTMRFGSEKRLINYRQMLYSVNKQGEFRYSTRREGMLKLHIMRLA